MGDLAWPYSNIKDSSLYASLTFCCMQIVWYSSSNLRISEFIFSNVVFQSSTGGAIPPAKQLSCQLHLQSSSLNLLDFRCTREVVFSSRGVVRTIRLLSASSNQKPTPWKRPLISQQSKRGNRSLNGTTSQTRPLYVQVLTNKCLGFKQCTKLICKQKQTSIQHLTRKV